MERQNDEKQSGKQSPAQSHSYITKQFERVTERLRVAGNFDDDQQHPPVDVQLVEAYLDRRLPREQELYVDDLINKSRNWAVTLWRIEFDRGRLASDLPNRQTPEAAIPPPPSERIEAALNRPWAEGEAERIIHAIRCNFSSEQSQSHPPVDNEVVRRYLNRTLPREQELLVDDLINSSPQWADAVMQWETDVGTPHAPLDSPDHSGNL